MADVNLPKEHADFADLGLALLGFASGSMDALAFFNLGQVFPSAMTGNTALLGLALGQGDVIAALRSLIAFAGFLAGAAAAAASVDLWLYKLPAPRGVCWLLALEACLLAAFAHRPYAVQESNARAIDKRGAPNFHANDVAISRRLTSQSAANPSTLLLPVFSCYGRKTGNFPRCDKEFRSVPFKFCPSFPWDTAFPCRFKNSEHFSTKQGNFLKFQGHCLN
jgi:Protein of unknown function (DUF1275)